MPGPRQWTLEIGFAEMELRTKRAMQMEHSIRSRTTTKKLLDILDTAEVMQASVMPTQICQPYENRTRRHAARITRLRRPYKDTMQTLLQLRPCTSFVR